MTKTYQQRKEQGLCTRCGGENDRTGKGYCSRCYTIDQGYRTMRAAKIHVALSTNGGSKMERIYSFIIQSGKIKPKQLEAEAMRKEGR
jgi:hypothetical protein